VSLGNELFLKRLHIINSILQMIFLIEKLTELYLLKRNIRIGYFCDSNYYASYSIKSFIALFFLVRIISFSTGILDFLFENKSNMKILIFHIKHYLNSHIKNNRGKRSIFNFFSLLGSLNELDQNLSYSLVDINQMSNKMKKIKWKITLNYVRVIVSISNRGRFNSIIGGFNRSRQLYDIIQEGIIGLVTAIDKFEEDYGYSFRTYATFWIKQSIQRCLYSDKSILSVPKYKLKKKQSVFVLYQNLAKKLNRIPTIFELVEYSGYSLRKLHFLLFSLKDIRIHFSENDLKQQKNSNTALKQNSYIDFIEFEHSNFEYFSLWYNIIKNYPDSIGVIVSMRYGIAPFSRHTLEELERIFSISSEKIRYLFRLSPRENLFKLSK
jgi:RNA polymerase sigma factor (sigma-70 family)